MRDTITLKWQTGVTQSFLWYRLRNYIKQCYKSFFFCLTCVPTRFPPLKQPVCKVKPLMFSHTLQLVNGDKSPYERDSCKFYHTVSVNTKLSIDLNRPNILTCQTHVLLITLIMTFFSSAQFGQQWYTTGMASWKLTEAELSLML